jgi:hypothetical protein
MYWLRRLVCAKRKDLRMHCSVVSTRDRDGMHPVCCIVLRVTWRSTAGHMLKPHSGYYCESANLLLFIPLLPVAYYQMLLTFAAVRSSNRRHFCYEQKTKFEIFAVFCRFLGVTRRLICYYQHCLLVRTGCLVWVCHCLWFTSGCMCATVGIKTCFVIQLHRVRENANIKYVSLFYKLLMRC